jgi:hypothetical protein
MENEQVQNKKMPIPWHGDFLDSVVVTDKTGEVIVSLFPPEPDHITSQTILKGVNIRESLLTPVVSGTITCLNTQSRNTGVLLFDKIKPLDHLQIGFKSRIHPIDPDDFDFNVFLGIILNKNIVTDEGSLGSAMDGFQKTNIFVLEFMNSDLYEATKKPSIEIPENESDIKDFIGWIADGGIGPDGISSGYSRPF